MEQINNDQTVAVKMISPSQELGTNAVVNRTVEVPTQTCQSSRSSNTCAATIEVSSSQEKFLPNEPTTKEPESMMTARNDTPPKVEMETTGHRTDAVDSSTPGCCCTFRRTCWDLPRTVSTSASSFPSRLATYCVPWCTSSSCPILSCENVARPVQSIDNV
jgi:hypothetical protein